MHIAMMVDLETLGLGVDAVILSAGVCVGDLDASDSDAPLFAKEYQIQLTSNVSRVVDLGTLSWWMTQLRDGNKLPPAEDTVDLCEFLTLLQNKWSKYSPDSIWSKGADFDIKLLEHAFKAQSLAIPWYYREVRCFRTLDALLNITNHPDTLLRREGEAEHSALGDAMYQYRLLRTYWNKLSVLKG